MFRLNPQTVKRIRRFREIKRGYYSFIILSTLLVVSLFGQLLISNRALIVSYQDKLYFPTYTHFHPGNDFGLNYAYETNYRQLQRKFEAEGSKNWVLMPPVPYDPYENSSSSGVFRPEPPSSKTEHYLGTDTTSRDILARLFYGTRIALFFALAFMACVYVIGITIGCAMGY
ncbi:MAG TPA: hypothetical protein VJ998_07765, partial [Pseudomonadales bacterium]|nr:hypothetical protein [Pseudomonadales bacterium]